MKHLRLLFLVLMLVFTGFYSCSDDDDDPVVVTYEMLIYNRDSGKFFALNTTTGQRTELGTIMYNGSPLYNIRGVAYNEANETLYVSTTDDGDGMLYNVNPETLQATVLNDNVADYWYAIQGLKMSNGKLLGTVYWDEYNVEFSTGLVWLNLDGTIHDTKPFMYEGHQYGICCGMALEYGSSSSQLLVSYYDDILISDLNGNVSQIVELTREGFPPMRGGSDIKIKSLERNANGTLYALTHNGILAEVDVSTGVMTYITLIEDNSEWQALTFIPDTIFEGG